jgi:hypothetical protein
MMEAVCTSETLVNINLTTWRYIPEDSKLQNGFRFEINAIMITKGFSPKLVNLE